MAFREARERAGWQHGFGGYTGTIAEKDSFVMAQGCPAGMAAMTYARVLTGAREDRVVAGVEGPMVGTVYADRECEKDGPDRYRVSIGADNVTRYFRRVVVERLELTASQLRDHAVWGEKRGPALCIPDGPGRWVFCGLAPE
jgi:hypothetical protein